VSHPKSQQKHSNIKLLRVCWSLSSDLVSQAQHRQAIFLAWDAGSERSCTLLIIWLYVLECTVQYRNFIFRVFTNEWLMRNSAIYVHSIHQHWKQINDF
jgi:hypothetical protein